MFLVNNNTDTGTNGHTNFQIRFLINDILPYLFLLSTNALDEKVHSSYSAKPQK